MAITFLREQFEEIVRQRMVASAHLRAFRFQRDLARRTGRPGNALQWSVATILAYRMLHLLRICKGTVGSIVDEKTAKSIDLKALEGSDPCQT